MRGTEYSGGRKRKEVLQWGKEDFPEVIWIGLTPVGFNLCWHLPGPAPAMSLENGKK